MNHQFNYIWPLLTVCGQNLVASPEVNVLAKNVFVKEQKMTCVCSMQKGNALHKYKTVLETKELGETSPAPHKPARQLEKHWKSRCSAWKPSTSESLPSPALSLPAWRLLPPFLTRLCFHLSLLGKLFCDLTVPPQPLSWRSFPAQRSPPPVTAASCLVSGSDCCHSSHTSFNADRQSAD